MQRLISQFECRKNKKILVAKKLMVTGVSGAQDIQFKHIQPQKLCYKNTGSSLVMTILQYSVFCTSKQLFLFFDKTKKFLVAFFIVLSVIT